MKLFITILVLIVVLMFMYVSKQKKERKKMQDDADYVEPVIEDDEEITH
jgi:preprotein translocase subunit YajC